MHKKPRVIFLESREGVESLFTRGLRTGATASGWHPQVVFLADRDGVPRAEKDVRIDLLKAHADAICFLMDAPLDLKNIWDAPSLASVDKISLWFDDYYRSPKTLAHPEIWADWQARRGVRVGIWDGYWRCQWKKLTGAEAFPIHLAADPRQFRPGAEPWNKEWSDRAVFVGTIPARKSLDEFAAAFPAHMRRFLEEIITAMNTAAWPIRPYELAQKARSFMPMRYTRAIDATLKDPGVLAVWNHLLWRWGKRIARLRGLAAVAKAGPLAVLSGHGVPKFTRARTKSALRSRPAPISSTPTRRTCLRSSGAASSVPENFRSRSPIRSRSRAACRSASLNAARAACRYSAITAPSSPRSFRPATASSPPSTTRRCNWSPRRCSR